MFEYRTEYSELNKRIMLEALITEREGMGWENHSRWLINEAPAYGETEFQVIADAMRELVEANNE